MVRTFFIAVVAAIAISNVVTTPGARAQVQDLPMAAFFGTFQGGGVAENEDSAYFGVTARDFDVVIEADQSGFAVTWTSVIRSGGNPANPDVRRKSATKKFRATPMEHVYRATDSGDPLTGGELCWARIMGNTLTVYIVTVRKGGAYEIQQYDRSLTGGGMDLVFKRIRDGEEVRTVKGKLVKTAR
jgi:hypothetical protein